MRLKLWRAAVLVAAMLCSAVATAVRPPPAAALDEAHHAYYDERFDHALALYEKLADAGDAAAAERAGFMRLVGEPMYGPRVRRDPPRAEMLLTQAAQAHRPGAAFLLGMLQRTE